MNRLCRIFAALLVLTALVSSAFGRANIICVESSSRISFGCDDVVPDEISVSPPVSVIQLGLSSVDCGMCHDYAFGQAVSHSVQDSAPPVALTALHLAAPRMRASLLLDVAKHIIVLDSFGNSSPLKC